MPADPAAIWKVLSSPDRLAQLTPLIKAITAKGPIWCWQLNGISALGVTVAPSFTERMTFTEGERIEFRHDPPTGADERAGAEGVYRLSDGGEGLTHLAVDITIEVELPLPAVSRRAVQRVMATSMERTGDRFAQNLYRHLGIDPAKVARGR